MNKIEVQNLQTLCISYIYNICSRVICMTQKIIFNTWKR